jgi:hypothetical protein
MKIHLNDQVMSYAFAIPCGLVSQVNFIDFIDKFFNSCGINLLKGATLKVERTFQWWDQVSGRNNHSMQTGHTCNGPYVIMII